MSPRWKNCTRRGPWEKKDDPALQLRHDMVRAKISAFIGTAGYRPPAAVRCRTTACRRDMPSAITTYRHGDLRSAIAQIDALRLCSPPTRIFTNCAAGRAGGRQAGRGHPAPAQGGCSSRIMRRSWGCYWAGAREQLIISPIRKKQLRNCARGGRARPRRRSAIPSSRWPMAEKEIMRRPCAPRPPIFAARQQDRAPPASRAKTRFAIGTPGWVKADDTCILCKAAAGQKSN